MIGTKYLGVASILLDLLSLVTWRSPGLSIELINRLRFITIDSFGRCLPNRSYDVMLAWQSLHHLFRPFQALEELARLATRNIIFVSEPCQTPIKRPPSLHTQTSLKRPIATSINSTPWTFIITWALIGFALNCKKVADSRSQPPIAKMLFINGLISSVRLREN